MKMSEIHTYKTKLLNKLRNRGFPSWSTTNFSILPRSGHNVRDEIDVLELNFLIYSAICTILKVSGQEIIDENR